MVEGDASVSDLFAEMMNVVPVAKQIDQLDVVRRDDDQIVAAIQVAKHRISGGDALRSIRPAKDLVEEKEMLMAIALRHDQRSHRLRLGEIIALSFDDAV